MARQVKKVICEFCGKEISASNYSKHLKRHENHPETFNYKVSYKLDHDDLFCKFCGKECKNKNSLVQHERLCKSNPNRQLTSYEKYGPIANFNNKGRIAWNKGLTKEVDERVLKQTETFKENHELGLHVNYFQPMSNSEVRKKHSDIMKRVYANYTRRTPGKFKYGYFNGIWCDSSWELAYLIYTKEHGENVVRNKLGFKYLWENSYHTYFPDFYLPDIDTYVEIKGYKSDRDIAKINQFAEKLIVIEKVDMKPILDYIEAKYGKNFTDLYFKSKVE